MSEENTTSEPAVQTVDIQYVGGRAAVLVPAVGATFERGATASVTHEQARALLVSPNFQPVGKDAKAFAKALTSNETAPAETNDEE